MGNSDRNTIVKHTFAPPIIARFLRIYPLTYNIYVCLRVELYECPAGQYTLFSFFLYNSITHFFVSLFIFLKLYIAYFLQVRKLCFYIIYTLHFSLLYMICAGFLQFNLFFFSCEELCT